MNESALRSADIVVTGATVLPFDDDWSVLEDCDVVICEDRIVECGSDVARGWSSSLVIDGRDLLLTPGLCNGHTHSPETLARGRADCSTLNGWLESVWSEMDQLDDESVRLGILLGAAEMLHGGVTSVVDHFRQTPMLRPSVDAAASAWLETGMRATLALMVRDRQLPTWVSNMTSCKEQINLLQQCTNCWHGSEGRLHVSVGPSAPTRCTDNLLRTAGTLCADNGIGLHMHVDETRDEVELAHTLYGASTIQHLGVLGLLGPHLSLAHCVWCSDHDLDLLASSGTAVVHNPVSNMRLGSGRAPIERMRKRGIDVAIGTDGAASNDSQSVLEAIKFAALMPRLVVDNPGDWITATDSLSMATVDAGRIFAMSEGRLAPGCRADIAAFELASLPFVPANDLHCQLAFGGATLRARHVIIAGRMILRDHAVQTFNETDVVAKACRKR